jgi:hypothetical protein
LEGDEGLVLEREGGMFGWDSWTHRH